MADEKQREKREVKAKKARGATFSLLGPDHELVKELCGRYQTIFKKINGENEYVEVPKSRVIRADVALLSKRTDEELYVAVNSVEKPKEGRPRKEESSEGTDLS